jgi:hypothetical protein
LSTCNIRGTIKDSGGIPLNGELWMQLDLQIVDETPNPDDIYTVKLHKFAIAAGVVNINLAESETQRVTYWFRFFAANPDNTETGLDDLPILNFHALVPNQPSVDLADLTPTGITKDTLDTAIARLARMLAQTADFAETLRGGPNPKGNYSPTTYYRKDDFVAYAGSGWLYINPDPAVGVAPSEATASHWQLAAKKGDPGGTGGNDVAYDASGWNGATWAPSANAIRDIIETLARKENAQLTGQPTTPTRLLTHEGSGIANCEYVTNKIGDRFTNATFETQLNTNNSTKPATTEFVKNTYHRYSLITDTKASGTVGGDAGAGINIRALNTINLNAGDVVQLSANTFTLRAGTYRTHIQSVSFFCGDNRLFLWDPDQEARILNGISVRNYNNQESILATLTGQFTLPANSALQLHQFCGQAHATYGFGIPLGEVGIDEIYTTIELWRLD